MENQNHHIHLGITCAGGGTSGAYIAGVLDYLLETLSQWEEEKQKAEKKDVPDFDVTIDVLGGNSAGSMSTALAVLSLYSKGYRPVKKPHKGKQLTDNFLYNSWVLFNNVGDGDILKELLKTDDLKKADSLTALFNRDAIDKVADKVIQQAMDGKSKYRLCDKVPPFVSDKFEFIISMANMKGMPWNIKFKSKPTDSGFTPGHTFYQHNLVAHFKPGKGDDEMPFGFTPTEVQDLELLFKCAKSSGSLPFVFQPRYFESKEISQAYIKYACEKFLMEDKKLAPKPKEFPQAYIKYAYKNIWMKDKALVVKLATNPKASPPFIKGDFRTVSEKLLPLHPVAKDLGAEPIQGGENKALENFHTVDGGMFNNEPFGEVIHLLNAQNPGVKNINKRLIMIDPFPTFDEKKHEYPAERIGMLKLAKLMYTALRHQGLGKLKELLDDRNANKEDVLYKGLIFPSVSLLKDKNGADDSNSKLACAQAQGLAGFLSKKFREHDFFLGRYNCQVFLRWYLGVPQNDMKGDPLHKIYTPAVKQKFGLKDEHPLQIIPDMNFYGKQFGEIKVKGKEKDKDKITPKTPERKAFIKAAENCKIKEEKIDALHGPLQERVRLLVKHAVKDVLWAAFDWVWEWSKNKAWWLVIVLSFFVMLAFALAIPILLFVVLIYFLLKNEFIIPTITNKILQMIKDELAENGMLIKSKERQEKFYRQLRRISTAIFVVGALTFIGTLVMGFHQQRELVCPADTAVNIAGESVILNLEFAADAGAAKKILDVCTIGGEAQKIDPSFLHHLRCEVYLDFPFLLFYSLLFALFAFYFYKKSSLAKQKGSKLYLLGLPLAALLLIGDIGENGQLLKILNDFDIGLSTANYTWLKIFTWAKWLSITFAFLLFALYFLKSLKNRRLLSTIIFISCLAPVVTGFVNFILYLNNGEKVNLTVAGDWNFSATSIGLFVLLIYVVVQRASNKYLLKT